MSSIREQIVAKAKVLLNTSPPDGVPDAERARTFDFAEADLPRRLVYWTDDSEEEIGGRDGTLKRHDMLLVVECYTKGSAELGADEAGDPLIVHTVETLANAEDFGNAADGQRMVSVIRLVKSEAAYQQGAYAVCRAALIFGVDFQSRADDATLTA